MKKIKFFIMIAVVIFLLASSAICYAATSFTDIKSTNWAYPYVSKLVERGSINGYSDGTFKPNNTITNAEFIKIIIGAIKGSQAVTDKHWATGYFSKAIELGVLEKDEINVTSYDQAMTRETMGSVISRVASKVQNENLTVNSKDSLISSISDYSKIKNSYQDYVLNVYSAKIITGYSDGTFGPQKTATRAEACTMIMKLLDPTLRTEVKQEMDKQEQSTFTITYKSGKSTVLPQKTATLSDLQIAKIDVYNGNQIRVFSKVEQSFAVFVGNNFTTDTISPTSNYWDVDGYKMYLFTSPVTPSGKEIRIVLGNTAYLIQGVKL